jgi:hypothetical protein
MMRSNAASRWVDWMTHVDEGPISVEPRWPIALAVAGFTAITVTLRVIEPHRESLGPTWLVPGIEIGLLAALLAADPPRVIARANWLRRLSIALVLTLVVVAVSSTAVLISDLIRGAGVAHSAGPLLTSGLWSGWSTVSSSGFSTGCSTAAGPSPATEESANFPTSPSPSR